MASPLRSLPLLLVGVLFLSGCAAYGADILYRHPGPDRASTPSSRQIERDVRSYVNHLDRYLRLDRRQRRSLEARLTDRTVHLMRTTKRPHRQNVYPFPREHDRYPNRTVRRWWSNADKDIERVLDRRQRSEFRRLNRDGSRMRNDRGRSNRGYDNRGRNNRYFDSGVQLDIAPREATIEARQ